MELHKLKAAEIRGLEAARLRETELEVRKELAKIRMDIYTAKSAHAGKVKGLKSSLARILTANSDVAAKKEDQNQRARKRARRRAQRKTKTK